MIKKAQHKFPAAPLLVTLGLLILLLAGCAASLKQLASTGGEANRGIRLVQEQKYDEAIVELERVIAAHPQIDGRPWYWLGVARHGKRLFPQAAQALEQSFVAGNSLSGKGIEIPLRESAYDYLGWCYLAAGRHALALQAFENGLKWSPRAYRPSVRENILTGMGWCKYHLGDFRGALQAFQQAIPLTTAASKGGELLSCYRGQAFVNLALANDDQVARWLDKARAIKSYNANLDLALICLVQGKKEKALEYWGGTVSIGVELADYQEGRVRGARVVTVAANETAAKADVRPGDILLTMDRQPINGASDFSGRIKALEPGKTIQLKLLRNGIGMLKTLTIGSAESALAAMPILAPVLKVRPLTISAAPAPPLPPQPQPEPAVEPSPEPAAARPILQIGGVSIEPETVKPGERFAVKIDMFAEDPSQAADQLSVVLDYAISKEGKILKQFDPEEIKVPNGNSYIFIKKTRASKTPGEYRIHIKLSREGLVQKQDIGLSIR
jgi:tetratricopeptide (TPR) repeat protein